jgi:hypothetical protein
MAAFNYTGRAEIIWPNGESTLRFIDWAADRDTLTVWPDQGEDFEYCGRMRDHPAKEIKFITFWEG